MESNNSLTGSQEMELTKVLIVDPASTLPSQLDMSGHLASCYLPSVYLGNVKTKSIGKKRFQMFL